VLGVISKKSGFAGAGQWTWALPNDANGTRTTSRPKMITDPQRRSVPDDDHLWEEMIILENGDPYAGGEEGVL
jgi:hypothetical protein